MGLLRLSRFRGPKEKGKGKTVELDKRFLAIGNIAEAAQRFGGVILRESEAPQELWDCGLQTQTLKLTGILFSPTRAGEIPAVFEPEESGPYILFHTWGTPTGNFEQIGIAADFNYGVRGWRLAERGDFEVLPENPRAPKAIVNDVFFHEGDEDEAEEDEGDEDEDE